MRAIHPAIQQRRILYVLLETLTILDKDRQVEEMTDLDVSDPNKFATVEAPAPAAPVRRV